MTDLHNLNIQIAKVRRNLSAMREVLSPRNSAVLTLEKRLQELLQEKNSAVEELAKATQNLPIPVQEMLKLRYAEGVKWGEIARRLHFCESTLYKWLSRYRKNLPSVFEEQKTMRRKFFTSC